jgi:hypothetical protein
LGSHQDVPWHCDLGRWGSCARLCALIFPYVVLPYVIHWFNEFGEPISYDTPLRSLYHSICYSVTSQCEDCAVCGMASRPFRVPTDSETNKGSVRFKNDKRRAEKNRAREPSLVASASSAFCSSVEFAGGEVHLYRSPT